ncbi:hypothetical protein AAFF_G00192410 [Aldrovandia affinis]|uniref:Uncharacterized protein n=1 Tax=Aldrovandia affinis TaxID=143900 RepID=A0AAD7RJB4_9TELE|nr:hypothetical protein AAFF_G00192410 [Aldrovandia affinis]
MVMFVDGKELSVVRKQAMKQEARILQTRRQHGEYHRLVQELRLDGERFQRYFRLDRAQFENFDAKEKFVHI